MNNNQDKDEKDKRPDFNRVDAPLGKNLGVKQIQITIVLSGRKNKMPELNSLKLYKTIVEELIELHKKHNNADPVNVLEVQQAALEILRYKIQFGI